MIPENEGISTETFAEGWGGVYMGAGGSGCIGDGGSTGIEGF